MFGPSTGTTVNNGTADLTPAFVTATGTVLVLFIEIAAKVTIAGASSTVGDGAGFTFVGTFKNVGGVVTQINVDHVLTSDKQFNGNVSFVISGVNITIRVQGAVNIGTVIWRARGVITIV